jgi:multidrug efflux pump subunit AcrA (membrane-fusion protein)
MLTGCERDGPEQTERTAVKTEMQEPGTEQAGGQDTVHEHEHDPEQPAGGDDSGHDHEHPKGSRIAIPETTRQNLGITFVKVEKRPVQGLVRLPGQFELRSKARREYHTMLSGRVDLLVDQYQVVEAGDPLFHLDSPEWQKMQNDLVAAYNAQRRSHADVAVAEARLEEQRQAAAFLEQRIAKLAEAQVRQVELEAELAQATNALPRLQAELDAAHVAFDSAHTRYDVMVSTAASVTGIPREELDPESDHHEHMSGPQPRWRTVSRLTIRAEAPGIIDHIAATNRGWLETGDLVLDTINPTALRFHADALQTDIELFENGQPARIVPPPGGSIALQDTIDGNITVGFQAHPEERTIPIFLVPSRLPRWAKAGMTAYLEVIVDGDSEAVPAIPEAAIVRDGLEKIFFLRDGHHPDEVIRVVAHLGASDGRWIEVRNPVHAGDEVVLGGVYPLMLATAGSSEIQPGGHFHADGTFHEGEDD